MLVGIVNREDPDKTASDQGLPCLSRPRFGRQLVFDILENLQQA